MSARLVGYVHLTDEDGNATRFGPDDEVPGWAVARITNPDAWEGGKVPAAERASDIPPKGGAGSGRDAWAAYAESKSVDVEPDATRDEIVAALDAAGVPTE